MVRPPPSSKEYSFAANASPTPSPHQLPNRLGSAAGAAAGAGGCTTGATAADPFAGVPGEAEGEPVDAVDVDVGAGVLAATCGLGVAATGFGSTGRSDCNAGKSPSAR